MKHLYLLYIIFIFIQPSYGNNFGKAKLIEIDGIFPQSGKIKFGYFDRTFHGDYIFLASYDIIGKNNIQKIKMIFPDSIQKKVNGFRIDFTDNFNQQISISSINIVGVEKLNSSEFRNYIFDHSGLNIDYSSLNTLTILPDDASIKLLSFDLHKLYLDIRQQEQSYLFLFLYICTLIILFSGIRKLKISGTAMLLLVFLVALPLKISWTNWVLLLMGFGSLFLFLIKKDRKIIIHPVFYGIVGLYIILLIGLLYTIDFEHGKNELSVTAVFLLFPVLFSLIQLSKDDFENILLYFVRFVTLYCICLLISFCYIYPVINASNLIEILNNSKEYHLYIFPYPSSSHPSFLSVFFSFSLPVVFYLRFLNKSEKKVSWGELILTVVFVLIIVILSGARIGLFIVPCLLFISFLFYWNVRRSKKVMVFGAGIIAALLLYLYVPFINKKMYDPARADLRQTALAAISERPLFGWGTGSMYYLLRSDNIAKKAGLMEPLNVNNHFHNQYLDELVQFGIIGSLIFFGLFIYLFIFAFKTKNYLLIAFFIIYIPFMFIESPFATTKGIQPMFFWLCFLLNVSKRNIV